MDSDWKTLDALHRLQAHRTPYPNAVPIAIRIRFRPDPSTAEYDRYLQELIRSHEDFEFIRHESGPEVLVWLSLATASAALLKSIIDLVTAIIKAGSKKVSAPDWPVQPVELIVRRADEIHGSCDEVIIRLGSKESADNIERNLSDALRKLSKPNELRKAAANPARSGRKQR